MEKVGDLGIALNLKVFRLDPKTKKILEKVWAGKDPFIANMLDILYGAFNNASVSISDTGGTTRSFTISAYLGYLSIGDFGDTSRGIVVGSSSAAVAFADYKLGFLIAHGTASGQLYYYQCATEWISDISGKRIRLFQRPIANKSGANITIYEMGLILESNGIYYFLLARDVISSGLVLANGECYLFQYSFEVS